MDRARPSIDGGFSSRTSSFISSATRFSSASPDCWCTASPTAEPHRKFHLGAVVDEFLHFTHLRFKVVDADVGAKPHFPQLGALLALSGFSVSFGVEIAQFSVVQHPHHWGISVGSYLHKVHIILAGVSQGLVGGHDPKLFSIFANDSYLGNSNLLVYSILPSDAPTSIRIIDKFST